MRGITFLVANEYDSILSKILNGILIENYIWKIEEDEIIFSQNGEIKDLFDSHILKGQEFNKVIHKNNYMVIFSNIQGYMSLNQQGDLDTYQDFLDSSCQIIILIYDTIYVDIYAKDEKIIKQLKKTQTIINLKK